MEDSGSASSIGDRIDWKSPVQKSGPGPQVQFKSVSIMGLVRRVDVEKRMFSMVCTLDLLTDHEKERINSRLDRKRPASASLVKLLQHSMTRSLLHKLRFLEARKAKLQARFKWQYIFSKSFGSAPVQISPNSKFVVQHIGSGALWTEADWSSLSQVYLCDCRLPCVSYM